MLLEAGQRQESWWVVDEKNEKACLLWERAYFDDFPIPSNGSVFELTVISRWGDTIFESNDVNDCWNGTSSNGNNVPDGAYTAIVKVLDGSGKWHVITQSVQLHRPQ